MEIDLPRMLFMIAPRELHDCTSSLEFQQLAWEIYLMTWAEHFKEKVKKPTITLKSIANKEF